ncbi:MAG: trypsin-like serine protease [Magnetospirillum sp.]|nr:trypsin-like serine protease [Magnetospirillum sp.]
MDASAAECRRHGGRRPSPTAVAIAAAVLLLALPAGADPVKGLKGIKGADDRVAVSGGEYPWSAVGRVNNGQGGHCSGALIGPALAVTAAHCLYNRKTGQQMPVSAMHFVAGYDRGRVLAHTLVKRATLAPGWRFGVAYGPGPAAHDWALLELEEAVGEQAGWVGLGEDPAASLRVVTVGYAQDRAHAPLAHVGCHITGRLGEGEGAWLHDCDAVHGDSGAPVMVWQGGKPLLTAIHVATFSAASGKVDGGAVGIGAFAARALKLGARPGQTGSAATALDGEMRKKVEGR